MARVHGCIVEVLERRVHLHAEHAIAGSSLSPEFVDYLNRLPMDSPLPFDFASHSGATDVDPASLSAPFTTILDNGPSANRVDIVLVGDGYTTSDLPVYYAHAQNMVNNFLNESPLNIYQPLFNVHRVDVVSNESGVDNDPVPGINRDTALDMYFWCNGIERLLCVHPTKAQQAAASAPQADQIIAVANSTKYGGAGGTVATFSGGNGAALEVALHEVGHSFAGLADEYDYGDGATYSGPERPEPNISIRNAANMASSQTKWWRWLDLPEVDTFQGAYYAQFGIYRPTFDSKMRSLFRPWDPVNTEQLVVSVYKRVRPIDNATPGGGHPSTMPFFVDPVDPVVNTMSVQWLINFQPIPGATGLTFDPSTLDLSGTHTLSVRVIDETPLVRDPNLRVNWMTQTRSWTLLDAIPPRVTASGIDVDQPSMRATVSFNEDVGATLSAADLVLQNLTSGTTIATSDISLSYDPATRTAAFTFPGFASGILPNGNYRATLPSGSVADAAGNALAADFEFDFFFLQGDATRDGVVDLADFNRLAGNFGQPGRLFSQGDFNYDTLVNLADFNILAGRFGVQLASSIGTEAPEAADRAEDEILPLLA